jgi:pSer/pThr/pTyr-binding forkhead associated (FHA) protein
MVLEDDLVSRHHVRVIPESGGALVEDLGSLNGTFVNGQEVHAPTRMRPGDHVLVGVTVLELRTADQVRAKPTAVRAVPPALAVPGREPNYVPSGDSRTKAQARTAALALFVLTALAVILFLATH